MAMVVVINSIIITVAVEEVSMPLRMALVEMVPPPNNRVIQKVKRVIPTCTLIIIRDIHLLVAIMVVQEDIITVPSKVGLTAVLLPKLPLMEHTILTTK